MIHVRSASLKTVFGSGGGRKKHEPGGNARTGVSYNAITGGELESVLDIGFIADVMM